MEPAHFWGADRAIHNGMLAQPASNFGFNDEMSHFYYFTNAESASHHRKRCELPAQNRRAFRFKPFFQNTGINATKIYVVLDIPLEQILGRETGVCAEQPGIHPVADYEKGRGGAVVSPTIGVFR